MIKRHLPLILLFTAVLLGSAPGGEIPDKGKRITQTILLEACRQNETTTLFALKDSHLSVIRNGLAHPEKGVKIGFSSSVLIATGRFSYSSSPLMGLRGEELSGRIYLDELPLLIFATENPPRLMYLRDGSVDMTLPCSMITAGQMEGKQTKNTTNTSFTIWTASFPPRKRIRRSTTA